jgi:hypothetical protein
MRRLSVAAFTRRDVRRLAGVLVASGAVPVEGGSGLGFDATGSTSKVFE